MLSLMYVSRRPLRFRMNSVVKAFIISETFFWSSWNTIMPIFAVFVDKDIIGGNVEIAATSVSVHLFARMLVELVIAKMLGTRNETDKFIFTIMGTTIVAISFVGFALSYDVLPLYFFYALAGVGMGVASPGKYSLFSTHLDKNKESVEWGIYDAITLFGMAIAAALGGFIAKLYGFRTLFLIAAVFTFVGSLPYFLYLHHSDGRLIKMRRLLGLEQDDATL